MEENLYQVIGIKHMIVIATNNGWKHIDNCLTFARTMNPNEKILVVDTQSSDTKYFDYLNDIREKYNCIVDRSSEAHYDYGAYIHAFRNYKEEDYYFFQHDSVYFKSSDAMNKMLINSNDNTVCIWCDFPRNYYDSAEQREWIKEIFDVIEFPVGIFGPNFLIRRTTLEKLNNIFDFSSIVVDNKMKQRGMERGWSVMFTKYGVGINILESIGSMRIATDIIDSDSCVYFTKIFNPERQ